MRKNISCVLGVVLAACASRTSEPASSSDDDLAIAPNGDQALVFLDRSDGLATGDWDPCRGKATCSPGQGIVGLSEIPGGSNRTALCRNLGPRFTGNVTALLTLDGNRDVRRAARAGDWAYGYYKLECGENEYVLGVSEDAQQCQGNRRFRAVRCGAASGLGDTCRARTMDRGDDRGTTASGDWDYGAYKGECAPNEYVAGVSVDPASGRAHSILCCGAAAPTDVFDALPYMQSTHGGTLEASDGSIVTFYQAPDAPNVPHRFYYVKRRPTAAHPDADVFERYAYDDRAIWLERDTSWPDGKSTDPACPTYAAYDAVNPDTHAYGSLVWALRSWHDGEAVTSRTQIIGYDQAACGWSARCKNNTEEKVTRTVHRYRGVDFGGSIGKVDAIAIDYDACETHWYALGWGWVKWQYNIGPTCRNPPPGSGQVVWNRWVRGETHVPKDCAARMPQPLTRP